MALVIELSYSDFWPQTWWCCHCRVFRTNYLYQVLRFSDTYLTLDWARFTVSSSTTHLKARVHFTLVLGYKLFSLLKTLMNLKQTIIYKLLPDNYRLSNTTLVINQRKTQVLRKGAVPRSSKRNDARWNKTALGSRGQAETSNKMEAFRSNWQLS